MFDARKITSSQLSFQVDNTTVVKEVEILRIARVSKPIWALRMRRAHPSSRLQSNPVAVKTRVESVNMHISIFNVKLLPKLHFSSGNGHVVHATRNEQQT